MSTQRTAADLRRSGFRWAALGISLFGAGLILSLAWLVFPSVTWPLVISAWVLFIPAGYSLFREVRLFRAAKRADR